LVGSGAAPPPPTAADVAFFFKQSAAPLTETGIHLDGKIVRHYPTPRRVPPLAATLF
jgi:hypothetical protein